MKLYKPVSQPLLLLSVLAVILLLAVACSGGTSSPTATPTEAETTSRPSPTSEKAPSADADAGQSATLAQSPEEGGQPAESASAPAQPTQEPQAKSADQQPSATAQTSQDPLEELTDEPTVQGLEPALTSGLAVGGNVGNLAPEFRAVTNWINSPPLTMEGLRGDVVLVDFWTYTCVNCIRTFPYLKEWHAKYAEKGLVIVGVHSPEFEFEKITENVVRSAGENDLVWPIAQDNEFGTWFAYNNRFWPAKYLVDKDGIVQYTHFGEGAYIETEEQIRQLLEEAGADLSDVKISTAEAPTADRRAYTGDQSTQITREIYGGYRRNATPQGIYVAHSAYYDGQDQNHSYIDPGDHQNQFIYLQGPWINGEENLRHARGTGNYEDYIALKFAATSVNAVIYPQGVEPFDVRVTIDDRPLTAKEGGADLVIANGHSFFRVTNGRLYEVVALPEFSVHELKLSSNSPDFAFFAFTFGAYPKGP